MRYLPLQNGAQPQAKTIAAYFSNQFYARREYSTFLSGDETQALAGLTEVFRLERRAGA